MERKKENFSNYIVNRDGSIFKKDGTPVKIFKSNKYLQCCLFDDEGGKHIMGVHAVIAMFYDDDWYKGCVVHHKDGDQHNNHVDNLEVMSRNEHTIQHQKEHTIFDIGEYSKTNQVGKNNPRAKAVRCVELDIVFETAREAERHTGALNGKISMCCNGKAKTAGGYHWQFA